MAAAIKSTLIGTLHKLCHWHILKKYKDHLSLLYKAYETFKDELTSVLNHPLMPSEFERAWQDLMGKYDLHNDEIMNALWADREDWISAYYKEVFCAWMTSTQRSESMNRILKLSGKDTTYTYLRRRWTDASRRGRETSMQRPWLTRYVTKKSY